MPVAHPHGALPTLLLLAAERCHQAITRRNGLDCEVEDVLKLIQLVESGLDKAGNLRTRPRESRTPLRT